MEDFSEAEQIEAYEVAYPTAGGAGQGSDNPLWVGPVIASRPRDRPPVAGAVA